MIGMCNARVALVLACAGAVSLAACGNDSAGSTTSPSPVAADATITERFETAVAVGGGAFYSFSIASYGNVAVTVTSVQGDDLPEEVTIGLGIGRPSGTSCATSAAISTAPGDTAQLTGIYRPGIFCVRVYDAGTLSAPVMVSATVAHS